MVLSDLRKLTAIWERSSDLRNTCDLGTDLRQRFEKTKNGCFCLVLSDLRKVTAIWERGSDLRILLHMLKFSKLSKIEGFLGKNKGSK